MNKPGKQHMAERIGEGLLLFLLLNNVGWLLFSWLADAAGYPINSLLSAEGLRRCFFEADFGAFSSGTFRLLLGLVVLGALRHSGLGSALCNRLRAGKRGGATTLRQRRALSLAGVALLAYIVVWAVLLLLPHSLLLSVTGRLFPSPFSHGLPLLLTGGAVLASAVYGSVSNRLRGWSETVQLFYIGLRFYAVWFVDYLLALQLFGMVTYIFQG